MRTRVLLLVAALLVAGLGTSGPARERRGPRCRGTAATITGTPKRDRIRGTPARDVIVARGGADRIAARGGPDVVCGGGGRDRIRGGRGADRLFGQRGADTIDGDAGKDLIRGGRGSDRCFQGTGRGRTGRCVPVIAAAGDIACSADDPDFNSTNGTARTCRMRFTSDLLLRTNLAAVLPLGDAQYGSTTLEGFRASYHPTWGRVKELTRPAVGNQEYSTSGAKGYFDYFGAAAGPPDRGYYSFDIGTWHLVSLNTSTDCTQVGGCAHGSPQHTWLVQDLAASKARCTLAYWHEPRFTSHGSNDPKVGPFWGALFEDRAEVILNGHAHVYERFAPQTPTGVRSRRGIRQFTVGTGGRDLRAFDGREPTSQVRHTGTFGVLELALAPRGYDWRFVAERGSPSFTDRGSGRCR